jgi:phage tail-like protein
MTTQSPIRASKPSERDPLRNFKFRVQFLGGNNPNLTNRVLADMGFMSVSGLGIQTDMIPYREGGDNTITRKLPGQSDVSPLTMVGGVFPGQETNPQMEWFKHVFAVNWGKGNTTFDQDFRCDIVIRVLNHPITKEPNANNDTGAAFRVYNAWPASIVFNDLNAGDNSILVTNMTIHHEGFEAFFGSDAKNNSLGV